MRARGFTYLWVLATLAMMSVGYVIAAEVYTTSATRDREKQLLFIGHQFRDAIERYHAAQVGGSNHEYPARLEQLLRDDRFPNVHRHLRRLYVDPMTGKADWAVVQVAGRIAGVHSLSDATPIKQGNFDPDDAGFEGKQKYSAWVFTYPAQQLLQGQGPAVRGLPGVMVPGQGDTLPGLRDPRQGDALPTQPGTAGPERGTTELRP
jgi:type II secretory pathway pseudopilin PulG